MKKIIRLFSIIASILLLFTSFGSAWQADKDSIFDIETPDGFNDVVHIILNQSDGKIIAGGQFNTYQGVFANKIIRLNTDGSRDNSFDIGDGFNYNVYSLAIQDDGKIIVGGQFSSYKGIAINNIIRLNTDGSKDTSFDIGNGFNGIVYSLSIQDDGKIVAVGNFTTYQGVSANRIIRLNTDGSKDTSFSIGNGFNNTVRSTIIQDDGKIIAGGDFTTYQEIVNNNIIRLNTDGSKDTSFDTGNGFNGIVYYLTIQDDSKIIAGGQFNTYQGVSANRIIRLNTDGSRDSSFDIGNGFNGIVNSLTIQDDGKIIAGGVFTTYQGVSASRIIRLNTNGSKDTSFDIGNGFNGIVYSLSIQDNEKILVGGIFTTYQGVSASRIIRLNTNGSKDTSFDTGNGFTDTIYSLTIQDNGKIIAGGDFTTYQGVSANRIIRLNTDGSKDTSFDIGNGFNGVVRSTIVQDDDKIIIGGNFSIYQGVSANRIIRLNTDGSRDTSFNIGDGFNNIIYSLDIQDDGKIVVGGSFTTYQGVAANRIIRLNTDGSRDTSFDIGNGFGGYVNSIAIQNDDKIVVGGQFTTYQDVTANRIIRLNTDGSRDSSFDIGDGFNNIANHLAIQDDDKIIVGGDFTTYQGVAANRITRLNIDGSRDTSFDIGNGFGGYVNSIAIQNDGKIVVGGRFTTYQGVSANRIIRLNTDGSRDSSFDIGIGFNNIVYSIVIQNDGKIFIGGLFTNYQNQPAGYLTILKGNNPLIIPSFADTNEIINRFTYRGYTLSGSVLSGSTPFLLSESNGLISTNLNIENQSNKIFLPGGLQFKKTSNGSNYTGAFIPPTPYSISTVDSKPVINAINVGSTTEGITLEDGAANLSVSTPTASIGDPVSIYSSQNGTDWRFEKGGIVSQVYGQPYVQFTTNHFTYFAIAGSTGSFVINNDEATTNSQTVNLTISAPSATGMRFSNVSGSDRSDWETISSTKSWALSAGYGEKTVYAQFIANGEVYNTSDNIEYVLSLLPGQTQGNIRLEITGGVTECVYGTSLDMNSQEVKIGVPYTFAGNFPSTWYCQDYRGINGGWTLTIQTTDLINEKSNIISGSNLLISHDPVVVEGDSACTGDNGTATQFYSAPYLLFAKASGSNKICKVSADNVSLLVNVPANQAPGNYSGTLTLTMNGF